MIITPIDVEFDILIDAADCNTNKSYSSEIRQSLNFSIGIETIEGHIPILAGIVKISVGSWMSDPFTFENGRFNGLIDTSVFGLGIHYMSLTFNETGYQFTSVTIQVTILADFNSV